MLYHFTYGAHGLVDTHDFPIRYAALVRFTTVEVHVHVAGGGLRVARVCLRAILCLMSFLNKVLLYRYVGDVWTDAIEKQAYR